MGSSEPVVFFLIFAPFSLIFFQLRFTFLIHHVYRVVKSADNTVEKNSSVFSLIPECAGCRQQGHAGSKTLH